MEYVRKNLISDASGERATLIFIFKNVSTLKPSKDQNGSNIVLIDKEKCTHSHSAYIIIIFHIFFLSELRKKNE